MIAAVAIAASSTITMTVIATLPPSTGTYSETGIKPLIPAMAPSTLTVATSSIPNPSAWNQRAVASIGFVPRPPSLLRASTPSAGTSTAVFGVAP